ncbi:MAG: hypothetical protein M3511_00575 [Deinococcota bacterium]|jgi:hypothetical protein|nr:hypothetical protein [Deinococcota bacterium]
MRVATGKVVAGKVVIEGEPLEEGSAVTVLLPEDNETFELALAEEVALLAAIAEADRGEVVSGEQVLNELRGHD